MHPSMSTSSGATFVHSSVIDGQRGWKVHPDGGSIGDGSSPLRTIRSLLLKGSATGVADRRALV